jgi:beta-1,4-mannosyl-glycoprotein beta-1,4-N-acetylglucosaminyltransferase
MKIIDCFIFYNELDLLNYRLNVLNEVVDYFVIVEATHTHAGHPKELFFKNNARMFEKFSSKIIHVVVDDFPHIFPNIDIVKKEQWINEKFQRNCVTRGLSKIPNLCDDDILIVSDLDEIPDPRVIRMCNINNVDILSLEMHLYYYNLHTKVKEKWYHAKLVSIGRLNKSKYSIDEVRFVKCNYIPNSGWHLSYFGDVKFIQNKLKNFAHQEFNTDAINDMDIISNKIKTHTNLFDDVKLENTPIKSNPYLPIGYEKYLLKFINL